MIRQRKDRDGLQVQVYAGRDPLTGRKRWVSRQVPGKDQGRDAQAKQIEAELLAQVAAGQHRGAHQDRGRAARALAGVAPDRAADLAHHRGRLPRLHRPLDPAQPSASSRSASWTPPPWTPSTPACAASGGKDGRPLAASSVRQIHAVLSGALNQAVVWGWISHNPARLASPPSREKADVQPPRSRTPPGCCRPRRPRTPSWACSCAWPWCSAPAGARFARCAGRMSTSTRARS